MSVVSVLTTAQALAAQSRAARVLHPYSVDEAEALEFGWLSETQSCALDKVRRLEYLLGGDAS